MKYLRTSTHLLAEVAGVGDGGEAVPGDPGRPPPVHPVGRSPPEVGQVQRLVPQQRVEVVR